MNAGQRESSVSAIEGARPSDLASIRWLLDIQFLPSADITEEALRYYLVYRDQLGVSGVIGLERYGDVALLRSLVVASERIAAQLIGAIAAFGLGRPLFSAPTPIAATPDIQSAPSPTDHAEAARV